MTRPAVLVRRATGEDLNAVVDVGRRTWPVTYEPIAGPEYVQMGLAKWWTQDANIPAIRAGRVLVAQVDDEIVAMSSTGMDDGELWMWKLYCLPGYQGVGAGSALMGATVSQARSDGHARMWVSYLDGNDHAAAFYHRHGFDQQRTEPGGSGIPDSVVLCRSLTAEDNDR